MFRSKRKAYVTLELTPKWLLKNGEFVFVGWDSKKVVGVNEHLSA